MASDLLRIHIQTIKFPSKHPSVPSPSSLPKTLLRPSSIPPSHSHQLSIFPSHLSFTLHCSSLPTPPTSREAAVLQAKTSLSTTLQKLLNNPKPVSKFKKQKQPRLRVEIPVIDDSSESITRLAFDILKDIPIRRKASLLLIWPNPNLTQAAIKAFESVSSDLIQHIDLSNAAIPGNRNLNSAELAVFLVPEASDLGAMRRVADEFHPNPVVLFNPKWGFEEESSFGEMGGFAGSFDVVYAFVGLEVRGFLSKRNGVIFKCVRDGVLSGEKWNVFVGEDGVLKLVSSLKSRPSIVEVETVLYNVAALNSPLTKSAKFLRKFLSNVTGKR